jgi:hypothetical protein
MKDLIVVETFTYRHQAELAQTALEAAGISSMISADDAGGEVVGLEFTRGVRLLVRPEDEEQARNILESTAIQDNSEPGEPDA